MNILSKFKDYYDYLNDPQDKTHIPLGKNPERSNKNVKQMGNSLPYNFNLCYDGSCNTYTHYFLPSNTTK